MKTIFLLLLLTGTLHAQVSLRDLDKSKGVYYLNGSPYSGNVIERYEDLDSTEFKFISLIEYTGYLQNGLKHGEWKYYDGENVSQIKNYSEGLKNGSWLYFYDGVLDFEAEYKNGKKDGIWSDYNYEGKLKRRVTYENGKWINDTMTEYYHRRKFRIGYQVDFGANLMGGSFSVHLHKKHGLYGSFLSVRKLWSGSHYYTVPNDVDTYYPGSSYSGKQENGSIDNGYSAQLGYFYQLLTRWDVNLNAHIGIGLTTVDRKNYEYSAYNSPANGEIWVLSNLESLKLTTPSFSTGLIIDISIIYWYLGYHYNPNRFNMGAGIRF